MAVSMLFLLKDSNRNGYHRMVGPVPKEVRMNDSDTCMAMVHMVIIKIRFSELTSRSVSNLFSGRILGFPVANRWVQTVNCPVVALLQKHFQWTMANKIDAANESRFLICRDVILHRGLCKNAQPLEFTVHKLICDDNN